MENKLGVGPSPSHSGTSFATAYHTPALVAPVLELLGDAALVLDGTLGGGGHSAALLAAGAGRVVGVDRDPQALTASARRLAGEIAAQRFCAVPGNYADPAGIPALDHLRFDGILLDLGISSHQIDDDARGFSFREGAPLDMRMGGAGETAGQLLDTRDEPTLAAIFRDFGDEPRASRLAREIVRRRATRPFVTADDLVGAIRGALGKRTGPSDFARLFQAVRIAVNDELAGLERALPALRDRLAPGGRFVIMSYHSGEDRLVKHAFRRWSEACICPPRHPVCSCGGDRALGAVLTRRAVTATSAETATNPRARSARLRAWQSAR